MLGAFLERGIYLKIQVIGSTKKENYLTKEEAIDFSGKAAGICYMPGTIEELFGEDLAKTEKRAMRTLKSGHHSVFDHPMYHLILVDIPKILAMILNNEGMYTTSEKSARYTKMKLSDREKELYEKWIGIFSKQINQIYPEIEERQVLKLAQENARYLISIFTPSTTMEYTVSFRQINYILHWFQDIIETNTKDEFTLLLKPYLKEFVEQLSDLYVPELNTNVKKRKISLFDDRKNRAEEFGENYCVTYLGSFAEFAQAQRHRTLQYKIRLLEEEQYYIPLIIKEDERLKEEWLKDISSLKEKYPQGMLVNIIERGTVENFILKCKERLCGCAQLEIMLQTKEILDKYIESTKDINPEVYEYLQEYSSGVRCKFKGWKCTEPCRWGSKYALTRKI